MLSWLKGLFGARKRVQEDIESSQQEALPVETVSDGENEYVQCYSCGTQIRVARTERRIELAHAPATLNAGDCIGDRYIVESFAGKGGMAMVYKAEDTLVKDTVAIKMMHAHVSRTQHGLDLFLKESQMARRMHHENIVVTHDLVWGHDGQLILSMDFIPGENLRQLVRARRKEQRHIKLSLAVKTTLQILKALDYAHQELIHRDLKPENIMIQPDGMVKLIDFGLAKPLAELQYETDTDSDREARRRVGTLEYAAPEQKTGEPFDARIDLFTVGLVLYELLTLRTPIDDPVDVRKVRKDFSPDLYAVIDTALEEDPNRRYQTAAAMHDALLAAYEDTQRNYRKKKAVLRDEAGVEMEPAEEGAEV